LRNTFFVFRENLDNYIRKEDLLMGKPNRVKRLGRERKKSYDELAAGLGTFDRPETRDVYEDDNASPVRSTLEQPQTMTSRLIFTIITSVLAAFLLYLLLSFVAGAASTILPGRSGATVTTESTGPAHDGASAEWDVETQGLKPVSYTHLTLPTIYSV